MLSESIYQAWYASNTAQGITATKTESVQWLVLRDPDEKLNLNLEAFPVGCSSTAAQPVACRYVALPSRPSVCRFQYSVCRLQYVCMPERSSFHSLLRN